MLLPYFKNTFCILYVAKRPVTEINTEMPLIKFALTANTLLRINVKKCFQSIPEAGKRSVCWQQVRAWKPGRPLQTTSHEQRRTCGLNYLSSWVGQWAVEMYSETVRGSSLRPYVCWLACHNSTMPCAYNQQLLNVFSALLWQPHPAATASDSACWWWVKVAIWNSILHWLISQVSICQCSFNKSQQQTRTC